ncbi:extracellular solute-binding protein [Halorussus gelatinilyticus]|uniref:Extracellular solute-binding protein n=1 Tax=Halorussus gelatinilyticus TaxID=2937524 RepID=A0A8U0ILW5_9EURY|nr:extracellular solute-binding protein [Halorussus gelatinilyticus]UPW01204.1 extracellular solute-binding protein [Halorussus gelatinilyticus]
MADNRSRTRRRFIATAGASGVAALAGCSGGGGDTSNDTTTTGSGGSEGTTVGTTMSGGEMADKIVFYNSGGLSSDPGTEKNIKRFEDETGITVEVNEVPWSNLKTSLTTNWRNQSSQIDAFNGPTWWLADFVNAGWIEPLGLSNAHMNKFPESLRSLVTFDGKTYMAPQLGKWGSYLYDKKVLSQAGYDAPPDTWDDILKMGPDLGSGNRSAFGFTWANKDVFMFKQFLYQAGSQLFNDSNQPTFVETGTKVFNDFLVPLREQGLIPDGTSSMGEGGVGDTFIAGNLATVESWTPLGSRVLGSDGWDESRLGSAKPPKGPSSRATFQDANGVAVSAFSKRKKAAKEFARFMSTTESSKTDMVVEGNPSVVPEVYDSSEVKEKYPADLVEDMKFNLEHAKSETYLAQPQVDNFLSNQITPALLGNKDPKKALQTARDNIVGLYQDIGVL